MHMHGLLCNRRRRDLQDGGTAKRIVDKALSQGLPMINKYHANKTATGDFLLYE
jgi:hypothetical protein